MAVCTMPPDSCINHSTKPTTITTALTPMATLRAGLLTAVDACSLARPRSLDAEKSRSSLARAPPCIYSDIMSLPSARRDSKLKAPCHDLPRAACATVPQEDGLPQKSGHLSRPKNVLDPRKGACKPAQCLETCGGSRTCTSPRRAADVRAHPCCPWHSPCGIRALPS